MNFSMDADPERDRIPIHGGGTTDFTTFTPNSETWAFDLATNTWSQIGLAGTLPPARLFHVAAFDRAASTLYIFGVGGEDFRILLNAAKVVTHLYGTLQYCIFWPAAMDGLRNFAAFVTIDVFTAAKTPCIWASFNYLDKIVLVAGAPFAATVLLLAGGVAWSYCTHTARVCLQALRNSANLGAMS